MEVEVEVEVHPRLLVEELEDLVVVEVGLVLVVVVQ
jgi:hypothetical protein